MSEKKIVGFTLAEQIDQAFRIIPQSGNLCFLEFITIFSCPMNYSQFVAYTKGNTTMYFEEARLGIV